MVLSTTNSSNSWIEIPSDCDFSLANIPFGICSFSSKQNSSSGGISTLSPNRPRCCTAIGNYAVDLYILSEAGLLDNLSIISSSSSEGNEDIIITNFHPRIIFSQSTLNDFMTCNKQIWIAVRNRLIQLFLHTDCIVKTFDECTLSPDTRLQTNVSLQNASIHLLQDATCYLPAHIGDYTDFYSSREHATNVGIMFRGKENALQPNWLHMPIGYHGRSSSVYPSGQRSSISTVRRPCGQIQIDPQDPMKGSYYGPCKLMDFELEVAFFVGGGDENGISGTTGSSNNCKPITIEEAKDRIFGYVLMNDWSARDIQKWEYVPLGPFTSKNFATTISTWVVTPMALEPFHCETSAGMQQGGTNGSFGTELSEGIDVGGSVNDGTTGVKSDPTPLDYLKDPDYGSYDVSLSVSLQPETSTQATIICQSNLKHLYWSSTQQLVHHSVTGCPMKAGDLLASGTISGKEHCNFGSMLELSWKGTREVKLDDGGVRKFLQDGDAVIIEGVCEKEGVGRVGFGQCLGRVLPALPFPYDSQIEKANQLQHSSGERFTNFKLYGYDQSSSTWRVRVALSAKGVSYQNVIINLSQKDQMSTTHTSRNPMQQVPILEFEECGKIVQLTQSLAIIEFLETAFPNRGGQLLPLDPVARAKAKEVAEIVNSGIQPLQNQSLRDSMESDVEGSGMKFATDVVEKGLASLEVLLAPYHSVDTSSGPFALGTYGPNLADICLIPQIRNARRIFGVDCGSYPSLLKIEEACKHHSWFRGNAPDDR